MTDDPALLAIVGPTASGKTQMAVEVAAELPVPVEAVSCDSVAVYRGLDVVAAKPSSAQRAALRHHMLDVVDTDEAFTAADYVARADAAVRDMASRGAVPMLVGGSGLYFRALVDRLEFAPTDPAVRARLEREDPRELYRRLVSADPAAAARVDPRNPRRVVRAVEILEVAGRPPSELRRSWDRRGEVAVAALTWDRVALYARVERRVDEMLARGLVDEVRRAAERGLSSTAAQAVGVKEVLDHLAGRASLAEVRTLLVRNTKRLVRRQYSWFRADPRVRWVDLSALGWERGRAQVRATLVRALERG